MQYRDISALLKVLIFAYYTNRQTGIKENRMNNEIRTENTNANPGKKKLLYQ